MESKEYNSANNTIKSSQLKIVLNILLKMNAL